jgi:hypothetical protein
LFIPALARNAHAETGEVSAIGSGHDAAEATLSLLRSTVAKYFKDEPSAVVRSVLQNEILPNAASFVQSYRVLDSKAGTMSISANVDLDVLRALFGLRPDKLGEPANAKALVVVRGARIPDNFTTPNATVNPYAALELAAKERFSRRRFTPVVLSAAEVQELGAGDDVSSAELLRGLGAKAEARLALGISSHYETFESEHSYHKEERVVFTAVLVDVKNGTVVGRTSTHFTNPVTKRDQYNIELQKLIVEDSRDLFQEVFVQAGKRLAKESAKDDSVVVRVLQPANAMLTGRLRTALEAVKGVKSVLEYSASRGHFDFRVKPAVSAAELSKGLLAQNLEDATITVVSPADAGAQPEEAVSPGLFVRVAPKAPAAAEGPVQPEGGPNAVKK